MDQEPARIVSLISAALTATIGVLTLFDVWSPKVGAALAVAAGAWVAVGGEVIRRRVWPTAHVPLGGRITTSPIVGGKDRPEPEEIGGGA
jgi:hypothetical protein